MYDFLLVINTNLPLILHHFGDIAFDRSKIAILCFNFPPTEEFLWDDLRKIFLGYQRMAKVSNGVETLPKISTGRIVKIAQHMAKLWGKSWLPQAPCAPGNCSAER